MSLTGVLSVANHLTEAVPGLLRNSFGAVSQWSGYVVKQIKETPNAMNQNSNYAIGVFLAANAFILGAANYLANRLDSRITNKTDDTPPLDAAQTGFKNVLVYSCFGGAVLAANIAVVKLTDYQVTRLTLAAITTAAIAGRILLNRYATKSAEVAAAPESPAKELTEEEKLAAAKKKEEDDAIAAAAAKDKEDVVPTKELSEEEKLAAAKKKEEDDAAAAAATVKEEQAPTSPKAKSPEKVSTPPKESSSAEKPDSKSKSPTKEPVAATTPKEEPNKPVATSPKAETEEKKATEEKKPEDKAETAPTTAPTAPTPAPIPTPDAGDVKSAEKKDDVGSPAGTPTTSPTTKKKKKGLLSKAKERLNPSEKKEKKEKKVEPESDVTTLI